MNWAVWQAAERCSGGAAPGAVALLRWLEGRWPQGWSGGIYNCRPVRGRQSMSIHAEGRAVDFMLPGVSNPAGIEIVRTLGANGDRNGVQTVIWDRRIWSRRSPNGRAYTGVNPHTDHLHIELNRTAASSLTVEQLGGMPSAQPRPTVRRGDRGVAVANAQRLLRVTADGIFGPRTEQAVRAFQQANGLKVDGIVGPRTWAALTS